ncbi:MAG TPA: protein kinase [Candidatus Tumulicola sp.]
MSYIVRNEASGKRGFLKAYDLQAVLEKAQKEPGFSPMESLNKLTAVYMFERDLLDDCGKMDRIIDLIDHGETFLKPADVSSFVPYIVCELADGGDIRNTLPLLDPKETEWRLSTLHHVATAIAQLHRRDIAHRDIKQANILDTEAGRKLGDLGSCTRRGRPEVHDSSFPGDMRFAAPEVVYGYEHPDWVSRHIPGDLYALGSVACFLFTGLSICKLQMHANLSVAHRPPFYGGLWKGTFQDARPYLVDAFGKTLQQIEAALPEPRGSFNYRPELMELIVQLSHPWPEERGVIERGGGRSLSLTKIISKFDLLVKKTRVRRRAIA